MPTADNARRDYRAALARELETRLAAAMARGSLPEQDLKIAAPALIGALFEGLIGPLATEAADDAERCATRCRP